ncbi:MAG TPA: metallophosphoesterase [Gemmatimonadales bacterium]|nr:metallophosphoesterase [Gemmatimonadales bacterium]
MRLALIADIHANAPALGAVLAHARRQRVDYVVGLGDIVGNSALPLGSEVFLYPGPLAELPADGFHFVNPGSVGDLTTRDPRAIYATLDLETRRVRFFRVPYDRGAVLSANTRQRTAAHLLEKTA